MVSRRKRILDAAERLLRHYGRSKTTVADIAREVGIAVGSVYLEFETKDAVVAALAERCHASVLGAMERGAKRTLPYSERLPLVMNARLRAFRKLYERGAHAPDVICCDCDAVSRVRAKFHDAEVGLIAELLDDAAAAGEFVVDAPQRVARNLLRIYDAFIDTQGHVEERDLRLTHTILLRGLLCRGDGKADEG